MEDSCEVYVAGAEGSEAGSGERTVSAGLRVAARTLAFSPAEVGGEGTLSRRVTAFDLDF